MTNTSSSSSSSASANMGWEIAGGKKAIKKPPTASSDNKSSKPGGKENIPVKFPKQEVLQPIKLEKSIYDVIRESDSDDSDEFMDEMNNNKIKKTTTTTTTKKANGSKKETSHESSSSPPASPQRSNGKKPQQPSSNHEPVSLLANSIVANQKKKTTTTSANRTPEQEVELTLAKLSLDEFERELNNLTALYPSNLLYVNQQLATFLNQKFIHIADFDPNSSHENETASLLSKADTKLSKFLNGAVSKLSRADSEKLFEILFSSLFVDSNKSPSNHGFKIYIQLVVKHAGRFDLTNIPKLNETLNNNKHRHQRCLIALWALSQLGYVNLANGVKVWFECMLPFLNAKGSTIYVASYLSALLSHHESKPSSKDSSRLIDLDQYTRLFEIVNDKSVVAAVGGSKEAAAKLKKALDVLRDGLVRDLEKKPEENFESLLSELKAESSSSPKQDDLLDILAHMLINHSKLILPKWKQVYSKYIGQSLIFLEYLSRRELRALKSIRNMSDTLRFFETHSSTTLNNHQTGVKDSKGFYAKNKSNKSNDIDLTRKFNQLTKKLISEHFRRTSRLSMVFRSIFILGLVIGAFFYWDANLNKSAYTKTIQVELKKYGLLEPTLKLINSVKSLFWTVRELLAYYIPIWYQKFNKTVLPVLNDAWKTTREYAYIAWVKSEPYREMVIVYVNQGVEFIHENFPVVMKNLISVFQLAINYATTVFNFVVFYVFQGIDFVGIQLLGWQKGDLEKAFVEAIKVSMEYLAQLVQKITEYLNKK